MLRKLLFFCIILSCFSASAQEFEYSYLPDSLSLLLEKDTLSLGEISNLINYARKKERDIGKSFVPLMIAIRDKARIINDTRGIIRTYHWQGKYFGHITEYSKAIEDHKRALELSKQLKDTMLIIASLNNMGSNYRKQDKNSAALTVLYEALEWSEGYKNEYWTAMIQNNIGNVFQGQKDYDKALKVFKESLSYGIENNNLQHLEISYGCIGETFLLQHQLDSAIYYINKSEEYSIKRKSSIGVALSSYLKGRVLLEQGKYKRAEESLQSSLNIHRFYKNTRYISYCLNALGVAYIKGKKYKLAEEKLLEAKQIALKIKSYENIIKASESLSELYREERRWEQSMEELKVAQNYKDMLFNESKIQLIEELNIAYETEKKEKKLQEERAKVVDAKLKRKKTLFISITVIILLLTISAVSFYVARSRRKVSEKQKELSELKTNFFNNISHEFVTPITLIKGTTEHLVETGGIDREQQEAYQTINRNCNRLLNLVNQLLNLARIDVGKYHYYFQKGNLAALLKDYIIPFERVAADKQLRFRSKVQETGEIWFSPELLETIVYNLLSNAIKYCASEGEIILGFTYDKARELARLSVINDTNVSRENLSLLFERFYQAKEGMRGVGLGLSITKEMANLYQGDISVEKINDEQIQFVFEFTTDKEKLPQEYIVEEQYKREDNVPIPNMWEDEEKGHSISVVENDVVPRILIVEDNKDMREYIASCFNGKYVVYMAENGKKGLAIAAEKIPDIIISDRVMPVMNGIEMCHFLRKDPITQHIPIVMLTAKAGADDIQAGLKCGVVDYITKPFYNRVLEMKINNILNIQNELKERYRKELVIKSLDMVFGEKEHDFAYKLQQVLDKHLTNPDLNVQLLSDLMGMTRSQLYRKVKEHTGLNVVEFIKTRRINLAVELLKTSKRVKGVCYDVGFNSPSYFTKTFKEIVGCLPSEYANK